MIDSTLYGADIPAGTYAPGDVVQLSLIDGPANVRSGRGAAKLKRISVGQVSEESGSVSRWKIYTKNSDWVDPTISVTASMRGSTALDEKSGLIQRGHDCDLTENSSWEVWAVCVDTVTTTVANSIYALIDIDYPSVSSIVDPDNLPGIPASIEVVTTGTALKAAGNLVGSTQEVSNVDFFKAGYEYALEKVEAIGTAGFQGFLSISNAAGMGGLKRIMPIASSPLNIRDKIEYASKLVKGPMDIGLNLFIPTLPATTGNLNIVFDFVKRKV